VSCAPVCTSWGERVRVELTGGDRALYVLLEPANRHRATSSSSAAISDSSRCSIRSRAPEPRVEHLHPRESFHANLVGTGRVRGIQRKDRTRV